jgi:hypothetical protein
LSLSLNAIAEKVEAILTSKIKSKRIRQTDTNDIDMAYAKSGKKGNKYLKKLIKSDKNGSSS